MSSTTTRRGLIGSAMGAGAGYAFAGPVVGAIARPTEKDCLPSPPGSATGAIALAPQGRTVWVTDTHSTTITARRGAGTTRGRSIDVGGAPRDIAISPDGRLALVTTAAYDRPGLAVVELRTGRVERLEVGPDPVAVAFAPDGRSAYVAGGGAKGTLTRVDPRSGRVHRPVSIGKQPRGLAITPDGKRATVALNGAGKLAIVGLGRDGRVQRLRTPEFPRELAISPDGRRAIVTHNGLDERKLTVVDLREREIERRTKVGADPAGIAFSRSGSRALVALGSGRAAVLDAHGRKLRAVKLGGFPRAVAVAGGSAYVADGRNGRLHRVRIGGLR